MLLLLCILLPITVSAAVAPPSDAHLGVATCASSVCHGSATPAATGDIQQNEYVTWARFDPHAGAYRTLFDERSVAIAKRLGLGNPHEAKICLDCHTDNVPAEQRGVKFQADGIGCEACHGGAAQWLATHDDTPRVTHADNLAQGMTALDDPGARAALCVRCHVGGQDRYASHRIMAAGHPRLSFELDTFTELWRTSGGREHYLRDADYAKRKTTPTATAVWTAGLVANSRAMIGLVREHYGKDGALPDFALFNCYSCHRAMRLHDWQDKGRDASAAPGSLRFDDSVLTMLDAALTARPQLQATLRPRIKGLQQAAGADRDAVGRAAAALDTSLAEVNAALAARPLAPAEARVALDTLAGGARRGDYPDYVGAEHAAMGIAVLASDAGIPSRSRQAIDELFRTLQDDDRYDPKRFGKALETLRKAP